MATCQMWRQKCLTIQDNPNTVTVNIFSVKKMLRISYITLQVLCQAMSKTRRLAENFHVSSFFISDEGFKIASCVAPQTWCSRDIQTWRVSRVLERWPLFLFKHLWTVLMKVLLRERERDMQCAQNLTPCILLNLPLRLAAVGCTLQWNSEAEINKCLKKLPLKLRHSDIIVV